MAALQALVNALREELVTRTLLHFTVLLTSSSSSFQASRSEDFVELVAAVRSTAQAARKVWQDWQQVNLNIVDLIRWKQSYRWKQVL